MGRALFPLGLMAVTGVWLTLAYPWPAGDGLALYVIRLVLGGLMVVSLVFGLLSILRRDFHVHAAWMTRGYAIGAAGGTQTLVLVPPTIALGGVLPGARA